MRPVVLHLCDLGLGIVGILPLVIRDLLARAFLVESAKFLGRRRFVRSDEPFLHRQGRHVLIPVSPPVSSQTMLSIAAFASSVRAVAPDFLSR